MLGVVVALESERRWIPRESPALIERTGIGHARARTGALALLDRGAAALVSFGTAGGLDPSLPPGTVVVPPLVVAPDGSEIPSDEAWSGRLLACVRQAVPVSRATLAAARDLIESPEQKRALRAATGAGAVDMESGGVAAVAAGHGVPWLAVRVILDAADTTVPQIAVAAIDGRGRIDRRFPRRAITAPARWPALLRLAAAQWKAGHSLRRVWDLAPELGWNEALDPEHAESPRS